MRIKSGEYSSSSDARDNPSQTHQRDDFTATRLWPLIQNIVTLVQEDYTLCIALPPLLPH